MSRGVFASLTVLVACASPGAAPSPGAASLYNSDDHTAELAALRAVEDALRSTTDWAAAPGWGAQAGPDPVAIVSIHNDDWPGHVVALRAGAFALVSDDGTVVDRFGGPPLASGVAWDGGGRVFMVGEGDGALNVYARVSGRQRVQVDGAQSLRAAAWRGPDVVVGDRHRGRVLSVVPETGRTEPLFGCMGVSSVAIAGRAVAANCVLERTLRVATARGAQISIQHDGPLWSLAAAEHGGAVLLAAGGVEDHALDRSDGAFGYIDSFVFVYAVEGGAARRVAAVNVSEHGIVTPKSVSLRLDDGEPVILVAGYGNDQLGEMRLEAGEASVRTRTLVPGITGVVGTFDEGVAISSLLDAWIRYDSDGFTVAPLDASDDRAWELRLGEALAFTTLMAPWNRSVGKRSRFTCEACHFEGTVDGRTHYTGRSDVHATTKTLMGLGNNRPHFSRALDRTMAQMVHNEFRVAGRGSGRDPWFSLEAQEFPWLRNFRGIPEQLGPLDLRRSLVAFLMAFRHDPNPAVRDLQSWSEPQRRGAETFRVHCESCHAARLIADDPATRIEPADWEAHVLRPGGPIVWGAQTRVQTGVTPYVHAEGARVPSLRRLWTKRPYLTNGAAADLEAVLDSVRVEPPAHRGTQGRQLTVGERADLLAFLDLL